MSKELRTVLNALIPAALGATIAGACIAAGDYVALISFEHVFEQWSWLPPGWDNAHGRAIAVADIVVTAPQVGFIAWWMYRMARISLQEQDKLSLQEQDKLR